MMKAWKTVRRMADPERLAGGANLVAGDSLEQLVEGEPTIAALDGQAGEVHEPRSVVGPSLARHLLARLEEGAGGRF